MILDDEESWIVEGVIGAIRDTLKLAESPNEYLRDVEPTSRNPNNPTRRIDLIAQQRLKSQLKILFRGNISFIAEEPEPNDARIPDDLKNSKTIVAILDPIDGTDLWVRGFGNWCISTAIFDPEESEILAAFVGYSSGDIYWATRHLMGRRDREDDNHPLAISRPNGLSLQDAAVCFYGQKPANFYAVHKNARLLTWLRDKRGRSPRLRIYNFAGNPMMVRMTQSSDIPAAVDAVFELKGRKSTTWCLVHSSRNAQGQLSWIYQAGRSIFMTLFDITS